MRTRIKCPSLAELWRILLARLEDLVGTAEAPALARSLAIAAWTGLPAHARGVSIERSGEDVVVTSLDQVPPVLSAARGGRAGARLLPSQRDHSLAAR
jgi:hypothetical protein